MASEDVAAGRKRKRAGSPSNSWLSGFTHEVFLSFRGPDTRKGFTDHLYSRLVDAGIQVFRDDEDLPAGEEIKQELKKAIKQSMISIAIFSKDYASSEHCLMELKQMWECRQSDGQIFIPIFYHVSPSDLKDRAGDFGRSLKKHEEDDKVDANTIKTWRSVLAEIKKLRGYELKNVKNGSESELVKVVLRRVRVVLKKDDQVVDEPVGIDRHVQEMMRKLGVVYRDGQANKVCGGDVRVIGICGVRGVGKTTLAKVVYNKMHPLFKECSFLEDMKLEEVTSLQERLIATLQKRKREALNSSSAGITKMESLFRKMQVLIVLDDVREDRQIKGLVGKLTWFGPGSRIIVTTDNESVLNGDNGAVEKYKVRPMEPHHALQLFRRFAFLGKAPQDYEYDSLSIDIVKAIGGLPMAIIRQASNLSEKRDDIETWRETSDYLRDHPPENVTPLFEDGYKSLDFRVKRMFLDIACFFTENDERIPPYMWKACDCYCPLGIDSLRKLHWLEKGENNELRMHNLIRDFGRDIVKRKVVHQRCRFWNHSDALEILENPRGSETVEGIGLTVEEGHVDSFKCEGFREMPNLRYLRLNRANIQGETKNLPSNLRWLDWRDCHSIPELHDTHLKKLVILDLSRSLVAQDPKIWSRIMEVEKLKVLNLQGCGLSGASLKFQAPIHLEILILEDCTQLSEIGTFISKLKGLKSLNLRNCKGVKQLPRQLHLMKYLKELLIDGTDIIKINIENDSLKDLEVLSACRCGKLENISPIGHLAKLKSLALDDATNWRPEAFKFPPDLRRLSLRNCPMFKELPPSIGELKKLEVMDLSDTKIKELPESVKELENLKTLKMVRTHLKKFPKGIVNLKNLEEIDFSFCKNLEGNIRCYISGLSSLRFLRLTSSNMAGLSKSIGRLCHRLQALDILECNQLHELPKLPSSLVSLRWGSKITTVTDLSYLTYLKELCLRDIEQPKAGLLNQETPDIKWITRLTSLESLELSLRNVSKLPGNFSDLTQLRELSLSYMKELDLTQFSSSSSLWTLRLKHCKIPELKFSSLKHLSELELEDCDLTQIDGLEDLKLLELLKVSFCNRIINLNGLKDLRRLRKVQVFPFDADRFSELRECGCEVDTCNPPSSRSMAG